MFDLFEEADPTPNKEYLLWIARQYAKGNIRKAEDLCARIQPALKKYHKLKQKPGFTPRDINQLQAGQIERLVALYDVPGKDKKLKKGTSKEVYSDANVRIIVPEDHAAACYYGRGTRWCTADLEAGDLFDRYNSDGQLYILIPKKPRNNNEKYQMYFTHGHFMDENDNPQSLLWLTEERFHGLSTFFKKHEPGIQDFIAFASDEVLQSVIDKIGVLAQDKITMILDDWMINDDGDEKHKDKARLFRKDAMEALQATPQQCRYFASEIIALKKGPEPNISDMDEVMAGIIYTEMAGKDGGLSVWIAHSLWVYFDIRSKQWAVDSFKY